jgi:hypothetical protein
MKGRYPGNRTSGSVELLQDFLKDAVHDYNCLRPHYEHYPKTPGEVYYGKALPFNKALRMKKGCSE